MLCITKELDEKIERIEYTGYEKDEVVFFDIETTGFSPETTVLYMIGCIYSAGQAHLYPMVRGKQGLTKGSPYSIYGIYQ